MEKIDESNLVSSYVKPITITFNVGNEWVMRITATGIEVNDNIAVTDAAKAVLDAIQELGFPKRVPMTEEVLNKLWGGFTDDMTRQQAMSFARAIERAHGIGEKE